MYLFYRLTFIIKENTYVFSKFLILFRISLIIETKLATVKAFEKCKMYFLYTKNNNILKK